MTPSSKNSPDSEAPPFDGAEDDDEAPPGVALDLAQDDAEPGSLARGAAVI